MPPLFILSMFKHLVLILPQNDAADLSQIALASKLDLSRSKVRLHILYGNLEQN